MVRPLGGGACWVVWRSRVESWMRDGHNNVEVWPSRKRTVTYLAAVSELADLKWVHIFLLCLLTNVVNFRATPLHSTTLA